MDGAGNSAIGERQESGQPAGRRLQFQHHRVRGADAWWAVRHVSNGTQRSFLKLYWLLFWWHNAFRATVLGSSGNEGQVSLSWIIKTKLYESFTNSTKWCKFIQHLWWSGNVKLFHCNMFTKAFHNFDHWLKEIVQLCDEICTRVGRLRKKCVKERDVKSISVDKCAKMRYLRTLTHQLFIY